MSNTFNRRSFLRRSGLTVAGLAAVGGASGFLAACGSDSKDDSSSSSGSGSKDFGTLDYQLSWIKNVEFAGQYIADTNGYYKDLGFSGVNLKAGGPNVQQDSVVASKKEAPMRSTAGVHRPMNSTTSSGLMGVPSTTTRSRKSTRCGDV